MIQRQIIVRPVAGITIRRDNLKTAAGMTVYTANTGMPPGQGKSRMIVGRRYPGGGRVALLTVLWKSLRHVI